MSTTRVSEYDRFGPWIDEVLDLEDVPRLFRSHPVDFDAARLVLKVPRDIARRDANAAMDLYDYLLILDASALTVLTRHGAGLRRRAAAGAAGGYEVMTVPVEQVVAIRDVVNILDARLTIVTAAGAEVSVRYNGAAHANTTRLVDELCASITGGPPSAAGRALLAAAPEVGAAPIRLAPGKADTVFISAFAKLSKSHPELVAWACHGRLSMTPNASGVPGTLQRALHVLTPMTLHGGLVASDGRALEVLGRRHWLERGRTPDYSTSRLVLPFGALERVTVAAHPRYDDARVVTLTAGRAAVEVVVPKGSEAARIFLAATASASD